MTIVSDNKYHAIGLALAGVAMASAQDAIVKSMSGSYPVFEAVMFRGAASMPILALWLSFRGGFGTLATPHWRRVLLRGLVLSSAYFAYVLAIAAMPMASAVSIYFTMPFFVAAFSGWALGETVPMHRWVAISAGFFGVIIMVRPGGESFQPASLLALYSAFAYAVGQMMGRSLSQRVDPLVIGNWQNMVYFGTAALLGIVIVGFGISADNSKTLAFLTRPPIWPNWHDGLVMMAMGIVASLAMIAYVNAYRLAPANFVAPFEYTAMIWALAYGALLFHDFPDHWTWIGTGVVVGAGLFMLWRDRVVKLQDKG